MTGRDSGQRDHGGKREPLGGGTPLTAAELAREFRAAINDLGDGKSSEGLLDLVLARAAHLTEPQRFVVLLVGADAALCRGVAHQFVGDMSRRIAGSTERLVQFTRFALATDDPDAPGEIVGALGLVDFGGEALEGAAALSEETIEGIVKILARHGQGALADKVLAYEKTPLQAARRKALSSTITLSSVVTLAIPKAHRLGTIRRLIEEAIGREWIFESLREDAGDFVEADAGAGETRPRQSSAWGNWPKTQFFLLSLAQSMGATGGDMVAILKTARRLSFADDRRILLQLRDILEREPRQANDEARKLLEALEKASMCP